MPCVMPHNSPSGAFELAAAYAKTNCDSAHSTNIATETANSLMKTAGDGRAVGSHSKCPSGNRKGSDIDGRATSVPKVKRLTTTLHARALKRSAKLLTHKLAVSHVHKDCSVSLQVPNKKTMRSCSSTEEKSLRNTDSVGVSEFSVYELPPTQSEVASEQQAKASSSKRKRVLTHEQVGTLHASYTSIEMFKKHKIVEVYIDVQCIQTK